MDLGAILVTLSDEHRARLARTSTLPNRVCSPLRVPYEDNNGFDCISAVAEALATWRHLGSHYSQQLRAKHFSAVCTTWPVFIIQKLTGEAACNDDGASLMRLGKPAQFSSRISPPVCVAFSRAMEAGEADAGVGDSLESAVMLGDAAEAILKEVTRAGTDLVILGREPNTRARRSPLGSVSSAVLRGAKCPVLLIPPADVIYAPGSPAKEEYAELGVAPLIR